MYAHVTHIRMSYCTVYCGTVVLWYCMTVLRAYGTVYCGTVVLWYCVTVVLYSMSGYTHETSS